MKSFQPLKTTAVIILSTALLLASGCGNKGTENGSPVQPSPTPTSTATATPSPTPTPTPTPTTSPSPSPTPTGDKQPPAVQVVANATSVEVLVNKAFSLPNPYVPKDLVEPNVQFTFKESLEKRKMRKEAAEALEKLFEAAKKDGLPLAGVSAYRSYETQTTLYNNYVKKDGEAAANRYSAKPGQSEHQTGLAIDVSGSNGKCAATDCFGNLPEAKWLKEHVAEFGFIIRYPKGKESITGYQYEPWHIRYVGVDIAKEIDKRGITLEEYLGKILPVSY